MIIFNNLKAGVCLSQLSGGGFTVQEIMLIACSHERYFLLLTNVNEWINNECAECVLPHLNICDWFTRSHPLKGENRTRNRSRGRAFKVKTLLFLLYGFIFFGRRIHNTYSDKRISLPILYR
jgi:hypothetical protein